MKTSRLVVALAVVGGSFYGIREMKGCISSAAPDTKLAGHLDDICKIARANIDTPARGVKKLGGFLGAHLGDMMGELGDTLAAIETTRDDAKHDERARTARSRILAPLRVCAGDLDQFAQAVSSDEEASELMAHFSERFNRTIEIIVGERTNVRALEQRLETLLR